MRQVGVLDDMVMLLDHINYQRGHVLHKRYQ